MDRLLRSILAETENGRRYLARIDEEKTKAKRARSERLRSRPRSEPSRKERKEAEKKGHARRTAEVRRAVWARMNPYGLAATNCECGCEQLVTWETFHMDHWRGGAERERLTDLENCWGLAPSCDESKTNARTPEEAEDWNQRRRIHCERYGIPFVPRKPTRYYAKETP
jgi:hypothetical protein